MNFFGFKWRAYAFAAFLLIFVLAGCGKDDDNPVDPGEKNNNTFGSGSITLNGSGYSNKTINFASVSGGYINSDTQTGISMVALDGSDSIIVTIIFDGKETGSRNFLVETGTEEIVNGVSLMKADLSEFFLSENNGSINISSYGNIGAKISGTFNGVLKSVLNNNDLNVSGSFSAVRLPDGE